MNVQNIIITLLSAFFITVKTEGAEKMKELPICGKLINLNESKVLFEDDFSDPAKNRNWIKTGSISHEIKNGSMELKWETGTKLKHGQIFSDKIFPSDIVMEFDAELIFPSDHDIIWWWNAQMKEDSSDWVEGSLGALGGWFSNCAGIEKISSKASSMTVMTPLFKVEGGRKYRIHSGSINNTYFLFVDGMLIIEFQNKKNENGGRIGFGVYQSQFKISNLTVYKPKSHNVRLSY